MLNDRVRNSKFEKAIENRVKNGCDTVLDVGTGTGLLRCVPDLLFRVIGCLSVA